MDVARRMSRLPIGTIGSVPGFHSNCWQEAFLHGINFYIECQIDIYMIPSYCPAWRGKENSVILVALAFVWFGVSTLGLYQPVPAEPPLVDFAAVGWADEAALLVGVAVVIILLDKSSWLYMTCERKERFK